MINVDLDARKIEIHDNTIVRGVEIAPPKRPWWKPFARKWQISITGNTVV
jgi:hypothetical protein